MTLTPDEIRQHQDWLDWIGRQAQSGTPQAITKTVRFDELTLLREILSVVAECLPEDQRAAILVDALARLEARKEANA